MIFAILALFVIGSEAIVCPPNACDSATCTDVSSCPKDQLSTGFCGCCPTCMTMLGEGHTCNPLSGLLLGVPSTHRCALGLVCKNGVCTAMHKRDARPCDVEKQQVQSKLLASQQQGMPLLGLSPPRCDSDGYYEPRQCKGSVCYCVMKDGTQIQNFKANIWEANTQTCQCARDLGEYMQSGLIGRLFHCTDNGNYQTYQCLGSVCYCVNSNGDQVGNNTASIGNINSLVC